MRTPNHRLVWAAVAGLLLLSPVAVRGQNLLNAQKVTPGVNVQDKPDISTLNFEFKNPEMIEVDVPGRGRMVVWFMLYWVSNYNKQPFTLRPEFVLLSNRRTLHRDEVIPEVFEEIRKLKDPTNRFKFKNSVTISETPIPVSKEDADPSRVAGIAIWPLWTIDGE